LTLPWRRVGAIEVALYAVDSRYSSAKEFLTPKPRGHFESSDQL
jgi:hypothetical protein